MSYQQLWLRTAVAIGVTLATGQALAAGFQLNEFSAVGLGRSYSGEGAMADSAASASRNPATMALFDRPEFSIGAVFIDPDVNISGSSPSGASLKADNIAPTAWVPDIHYVQPLNDQWWVGASVTSNYGLATEYANGYTAGPYGGKTDLSTANFNLSTAWRMNPHLSFGVGFDAIYAKAKLERYAGESFAAYGVPADTRISRLKGDKWAYGWNAGILYEVDENNRFGLTYRSEVKVKFHGDYSSQLPAAYNPVWQQAGLYGTSGNTIPGALSLNLPEMWEVSGWHKVAPRWAIHYSMAYTSWSQFQELKATGNDGQTLLQKDEKFRDAYRLALGTTWFYDDHWTFRSGIAFDDSPVSAGNRSISIPDQDRLWLSAGASYAFTPSASVDVGVSYMHGQHVTIHEGPYTFNSSGNAWLYGAGFNYRF